MAKRRLVTALAKYGINPFVKAAIRTRVQPSWLFLLETTGRRSGSPRRTPVGGRLEGDSIWIVAEHGIRAGYVRNIEANPRVRVRQRAGWRQGTATVLADDDWRARLRALGQGRPGLKMNGVVVRTMATEPATVRIDLD